MRAFWGKDKFIYNVELCFSTLLEKGEGVSIRLIAKDVYNLFVNGKFVCYGPARSAKGYARSDEIDLTPYLTQPQNRISVFVQSNATKTMCFSSDGPYFGCEILSGGKVVKDGGDFDCYFMTDKVVKVEKMSFQRTFLEVYDMQKDRKHFGDAFLPIEKIEVKTPELLQRNVAFAKNQEIFATLFERGEASFNGEVTWENDFVNFQLKEGKNYYAYLRKDCDVKLSYELDKLVYDDGGGYEYSIYRFPCVTVGKFILKARALTDCTVWLIYDDLLIDGKVKFNREQIIHGLKWSLNEGEYDLLSNEVYQAKYVSLVVKGRLEVDKLGILKIENPEVSPEDFVYEDEDVTKIVQASVRTFIHNAYDLPTDCASRERAGYLCDGYFVARAERFFVGTNKVERNLLENYLYYKNEIYDDGGILPSCYPSAPKSKEDFIPNWILWYIVQLADCLKRTGDRSFIDKHKPQVDRILKYFERYENEWGLLENLDGWVFVEWSRANDFIDGVNFPSNMLYAGALKCVYDLYGDEKALEKAKKVKETIKKMSFNGELFIDNAVRRNGKLVLTDNVSETCQNYAAFFDIVSSKENPEFYRKLDLRFGVADQTSPKVWKSNMFIGYVLRLEVLYREKKYDLIVKECKKEFLPMVNQTGTIWEHFEPHSSCNHGFGSIVGAILAKSIEKINKGKR